VRTYTQEEWDARELEVQQEITKNSKLRELHNWYKNDPVGQKAWRAQQKVAAGEYDPDAAPLTKTDESALSARDKKIEELEGIVTEIQGRTQLNDLKAQVRASNPWLTEDHIKKGVAYFAENGGDFVGAIKLANFDDWVAHASSSSSGDSPTDTPRGALDTSRAPGPQLSSDPYLSAKQSSERIDAKIAAATGG